MRYLAAVVQLTTTNDPVASVADAESKVREAAARGARFVALPEAVNFLGREEDKKTVAERLEDGPTFQRFGAWARELSITLSAGSIPETSDEPERLHNTSVLFGPDGTARAVYRKIHLFDAEVGDGRSYRESARTKPGTEGVIAETELGRFGLSICYDLRFPSLYRAYARAKADVLLVPSAFTVPTGQLHWEILLRARAIENQCFVVAAAQVGDHGRGRRTYGHSMIVDPSGRILAQIPSGPGVAVAEIDLSVRAEWAQRLPTSQQERPFEVRSL
ncbi:MAG: carbon-nitrogen hydrolase family protein [Myxococcota bacterium]